MDTTVRCKATSWAIVSVLMMTSALANEPARIESAGYMTVVMSPEATDCTINWQQGHWTDILWRSLDEDGSIIDRGSALIQNESDNTRKCVELGIHVGELCSGQSVLIRINMRRFADIKATHPMIGEPGWAPPPGWIIDQYNLDAEPGLKRRIKTAFITLQTTKDCESI